MEKERKKDSGGIRQGWDQAHSEEKGNGGDGSALTSRLNSLLV